MAGYGLVVLGPSLHFWFNFVSKLFPRRDLFSTLKKMVLGQAVYGPFMTVVFFSLNAALQGENSREIGARLKRDLLPTMLNGVMYWPVCDFITFRFIPVHLQPLVSNSFSYVWTIYMTYMAGLDKAEEAS
ncbi:PXMP2/4 family protein 4 [Senna tora]|uniref:PXMP2/4 family protein 4 n=1 Tax=Senna tora TaxID=362788 RepID=A0A835CIW7_9FABA|nr:PXMP2/4 family protein 4 [Senna tora]